MSLRILLRQQFALLVMKNHEALHIWHTKVRQSAGEKVGASLIRPLGSFQPKKLWLRRIDYQ
jgi:hypothetical protein